MALIWGVTRLRLVCLISLIMVWTPECCAIHRRAGVDVVIIFGFKGQLLTQRRASSWSDGLIEPHSHDSLIVDSSL